MSRFKITESTVWDQVIDEFVAIILDVLVTDTEKIRVDGEEQASFEKLCRELHGVSLWRVSGNNRLEEAGT